MVMRWSHEPLDSIIYFGKQRVFQVNFSRRSKCFSIFKALLKAISVLQAREISNTWRPMCNLRLECCTCDECSDEIISWWVLCHNDGEQKTDTAVDNMERKERDTSLLRAARRRLSTTPFPPPHRHLCREDPVTCAISAALPLCMWRVKPQPQ